MLILIITALPFGIIGAGNRGVVFNNGSGLEKGRILSEGTYWRTPFFENVISMPVRVQKSDFTEQAGSKDSQIINVNLTVNWHLDAGKVDVIYDQIGNIDQVESIAFTNNVQDAAKAAISRYEALQVQQNRDNVVAIARDYLQRKVKPYHVIIDGVSFTNISFSPQFTDAIEAAQTAAQNAIAAQNNANAKINTAIGESRAQQLQQQTLTPLFVESKLVDGLNSGHIKLPTTLIMGGNQSLSQFLLSLPSTP